MINWIKSKIYSEEKFMDSEFEKTFSALLDLAKSNRDAAAEHSYRLIQSLNFDTSQEDSDTLAEEINKIRYASNTTGFFIFFFPIVAHVLYFKPKLESKILFQIIGPNFANGVDDPLKMIKLMQSAMNNMLAKNKNYMSDEAAKWVLESLPNMKNEIKREIEKCQLPLNK